MKTAKHISFAIAACLAASHAVHAEGLADFEKGRFAEGVTPLSADAVDKAASSRSVGARSTVTLTATAYGGFELAAPATVYILVRGNSLGTLGVTQNYLDFPRLRLFNSAGADLVFDVAGRPGFNRCTSSTDQAVINFYAARGAPVNINDACIGANFSAGAFTFTVVPTPASLGSASVPSSGEILFEAVLGP